jgi:integral membrane protein
MDLDRPLQVTLRSRESTGTRIPDDALPSFPMQKINQPFLQWLFVGGLIEGVSTLVLFFVAMPLKYYADLPIAVSIVGPIHGVLFVALVVLFILGRKSVPLPTWLVLAGIVAATVPFGPFIVDVKLARMLREARTG